MALAAKHFTLTLLDTIGYYWILFYTIGYYWMMVEISSLKETGRRQK